LFGEQEKLTIVATTLLREPVSFGNCHQPIPPQTPNKRSKENRKSFVGKLYDKVKSLKKS